MTKQYTEADIASLSQKLDNFAKTLSPGEQAAFARAVNRIAGASGDVEGYSSSQPKYYLGDINWAVIIGPDPDTDTDGYEVVDESGKTVHFFHGES